jgi:prepilin-type N-terminal cleavage/methylation domain-containing protein
MKSKTGFTLIEVLAAMAVLVILVLALTRMFMQAADITKRGNTALMRNSTGETALETLLQDAESMMVNERLACYVEADVTDPNGFGFDDVWFISTSGDQDDHMPYEYNHFFVTNRIATNAMGAAYMRFDLMKARMIFAVGDNNGFYALDPNFVDWWKHAMTSGANWDLQTLAEHVVRFDIYCTGWDGKGWMGGNSGVHEFDSTRGPNGQPPRDVPPAAFDIYLQITSPDAAVEGGMALVDGIPPEVQLKARELMIKDSASLFGRAVPITGAARYNTVTVYGTNNTAYYHP